jgi:hypothetical protein
VKWRQGKEYKNKKLVPSKYFEQYGNNENITISWSDSKDNFLLWVNEPIAAFRTKEAAKRFFKKMEKES